MMVLGILSSLNLATECACIGLLLSCDGHLGCQFSIVGVLTCLLVPNILYVCFKPVFIGYGRVPSCGSM